MTQSMLAAVARKRAVSGFEPWNLASCESWLEADAIVGLNDNDPITTVPDASANNNDGTGGGTGRVYKENIINGLPVMRFTGGYIGGACSITTTKATVILVGSAASSSGFGRFLSLAATATDDYDNAAYTLVCARNNTVTAYRAFGEYTGPAITHDVPVIASVTYDGTNVTIRVSGESDVVIASTGTFNISAFRMGLSLNGTDAFTGDIAVMGIFNDELSAGDRGDTETLLATKYGL